MIFDFPLRHGLRRPLLIFLWAVSLAHATDQPLDTATGDSAQPGIAFFDMRAAAAVNDVQWGGRVGIGTVTRIGLDFLIDFEMRPYRRAVRVRESDALYYQFREDRLTIGPGMLVRVPLGESGTVLAMGGGGSLSFGEYRGTKREAPFKALPWLETGIRFNRSSGVDWGFSYQYFPIPGVSAHRAAVHFGFRLEGQ
jgi:hypothetical protein